MDQRRMKKTALTAFLALVLAVPGFAGDFRRAEWGMTKEQVKAVEKEAPLQSRGESLLKYKTQIMGLDVHIYYYFEKGRLRHGSYDFISVPESGCSEIFDKLVETISKKYGEAKEELIWKDDSLKTPKPSSTAVAFGFLKRAAEWETEKTVIRLSLSSEKYGDPITLDIYYVSKEDREQEEMKWIEETF